MLKNSHHHTLVSLLIILLLCSGCGIKSNNNPRSTQPITLTVLAAASLTEAFKDLGQQFESVHPGTRVEFNFAGSQQLAQQLGNGAPADVFASADQRQMDTAIAAKRIDKNTLHFFIQNRLIIIYPKQGDHNIHTLADLSRPGVKLVLASKEVPVGKYSLDFLARAASDPSFGASYQTAVIGNVVSYEDNVKGVLTKVALGEADAGIVYTSDAYGSAGQRVGQIPIPDSLNVVAQYPIAPLLDSHQPALSQDFIVFVLSPAGQQTLERYGFIPIGGSK